jgi:hypothetical protein
LISARPRLNPKGLRLCRAAPAGSILAGDILEIGKRIAETGKIVAGFVDVASLRLAPFPPGTHSSSCNKKIATALTID